MKKSFRYLLASTLVATQFVAGQAYASDQNALQRITQKVMDKIRNTDIKVGAGLDVLKFDIDDVIDAGAGIKYRYVLDNDLGKVLREDMWSDYVEIGVSPGILLAKRQLQRDVAFGRFFEKEQWSTALKTFLFSPLDLRDLSSQKVSQLIDAGKLKAGDSMSVTLDKTTFLGLGASAHSGGVTVDGRIGKAFVGKITVKLLLKKDKKVTLTFADADENSIEAGGDVKIGLGLGGLSLKILSIDEQFRLRGTADLETFTYDLNSPRAAQALDKVLGALDKPTILFDKKSLNQFIQVSPYLAKGLIDITDSQIASDDMTSGVVREQQLNNNIVSGNYGRIKINLLPGLLQTTDTNRQNTNLVNIKMSGSFIKPGQYIIGYKSKESSEKIFGKSENIGNVTSFVYKPNPELTRPADANGYRGLADLIGISYHTDSKQNENPKEMVTYAKLCNAGLVNCPAPIDLRVVDPESPDAKQAQGKSMMNSNYFFSRGLFEKIKERMNWDRSSANQNQDSIKQAITPVLREITLPGEQQNKEMALVTNFLYEVFQNDCYSNLSGVQAKVPQSGGGLLGKLNHILSPKCGSTLYSIDDEVVRLNMPTLLISMYDPTMLPPSSEPTRKASADQIRELSKVFSVTISTRAVNEDGTERLVKGNTFGMSLEDSSTDASQIAEFTNLVSIWQQQQHNDLNYFDRVKMIQARQ
jgi:hypothetical protein